MATINVNVFNTSSGSVALAGVYVALYDKAANTTTQGVTNASGVYSFTGLAAGSYSVYNIGTNISGNPPTSCGFPTGFTGTTTARRLDYTVTAAQTVTATFKYDKPIPWTSQNNGNVPNIALTTDGTNGKGVNLATGAITVLPNIVNNGMGYSLADNMLYGNNMTSRSDYSGNAITLTPPYTYSMAAIIGDCDENSYFYGENVSNSQFTCIDVNPYRTTYLRPVNPYLSFQEVFTAPYGVNYTGAPTATNDNDWAYVPSVQGIVAGTGTTNIMWILSLTTPKAYNVPIVGTGYTFVGVNFADMKNMYIPTGSQILKFQMSTTVANGSVLAPSTVALSGDGARAVTAAVFFANPVLRKTVDKSYGIIGDTLKYTVTIVNTGITTATNAVFNDTVPIGTSFVTDSVYVNGVQQTGVTPSNIDLGTLPIGEVFTINFDAKIDTNTLPNVKNFAEVNASYFDSATSSIFNQNYDSNIVTTTIVNPASVTNKIVNKNFAATGDSLLYTIAVQNTGNTTIKNCIIVDTTPDGTSFITNSVAVNGVTVPGATLSPAGYDIGTIGAGAISTITFKVAVTTVPGINVITIPNSAFESVTYITNPSTGSTSTSTQTTNIVNTLVVSANLSGITKSVDKTFATCGDQITYTIVVPNSGNTTAFNVIIKDTIPNSTAFVTNSVVVNGTTINGVNPLTGVNIGTISSGAVSTMTFNVMVNC